MRNKFRLIATASLATILSLVTSLSANAQSKDINSILLQGKTLLKGASESFVDIILILVGLSGVVMVVPNLIKHAKSDPSASDAFIKLGTGLILAFLVIQFCRLVF
jgi:hypothetical protein